MSGTATREEQMAALLEACVAAGFGEVVGYTDCRGCRAAHEDTGEWWIDLEGRDHEADCPVFPFEMARRYLERLQR